MERGEERGEKREEGREGEEKDGPMRPGVVGGFGLERDVDILHVVGQTSRATG